ncbi:hypothetical protein AB0425_38235 [Actinosynnema sp. NPDC051121]
MRKLSIALVGLLAAVLLGSGTAAAKPAPKPGVPEVGTEAVVSCRGGSAWCTWPIVDLNLRTGPHTNSTVVITMPAGDYFVITCWVWGDSVNGDLIWYYGQHWEADLPSNQWEWGFAAGYYLSTGADPHPYFNNCVDS